MNHILYKNVRVLSSCFCILAAICYGSFRCFYLNYVLGGGEDKCEVDGLCLDDETKGFKITSSFLLFCVIYLSKHNKFYSITAVFT